MPQQIFIIPYLSKKSVFLKSTAPRIIFFIGKNKIFGGAQGKQFSNNHFLRKT